MTARQRHWALAQVLADGAREVRRVVLVAEEVFFVNAHLCEVETLTIAAATSDGSSRGVKRPAKTARSGSGAGGGSHEFRFGRGVGNEMRLLPLRFNVNKSCSYVE